jgi:hypothetical protein
MLHLRSATSSPADVWRTFCRRFEPELGPEQLRQGELDLVAEPFSAAVAVAHDASLRVFVDGDRDPDRQVG